MKKLLNLTIVTLSVLGLSSTALATKSTQTTAVSGVVNIHDARSRDEKDVSVQYVVGGVPASDQTCASHGYLGIDKSITFGNNGQICPSQPVREIVVTWKVEGAPETSRREAKVNFDSFWHTHYCTISATAHNNTQGNPEITLNTRCES